MTQPGQLYDWTCSAASLDWLKRAMSLVTTDDIYGSRETTTYQIGYPDQINPQYGLMDGSGFALQDVLATEYSVGTDQGWLDFDTAYSIFESTPGMMSGASWYHWVGVRGVQGSTIWVANSAPGYKGIYSNVGRDDWARLGSFSCVWTV